MPSRRHSKLCRRQLVAALAPPLPSLSSPRFCCAQRFHVSPCPCEAFQCFSLLFVSKLCRSSALLPILSLRMSRLCCAAAMPLCSELGSSIASFASLCLAAASQCLAFAMRVCSLRRRCHRRPKSRMRSCPCRSFATVRFLGRSRSLATRLLRLPCIRLPS